MSEQDVAKPEPRVEQETVTETPAEAEAPELEAVDVAAVEAILFTTDTPLSPAKIADVAELAGGRRAAREAIDLLNERYEQMGCSFRIESVAGGYRMLTLPEYNDLLSQLLKVRSESKLSQASLETLAIIAYRQPILRADIEAIRGVSSGEIVRGLMDKGLVKIVGRAEEIGRPMLYGTTRKFLEVFGMNSLKDLPEVAELAGGVAAARRTQAEADEQAPVSQEVEAVGEAPDSEVPADQPTDEEPAGLE